MNCYIFVLVGFLRCLKDHGSCVLRGRKMKLFLEKEQLMKKTNKKKESLTRKLLWTPPGPSPERGPIKENLATRFRSRFNFLPGQKTFEIIICTLGQLTKPTSSPLLFFLFVTFHFIFGPCGPGYKYSSCEVRPP